MTTPGEDAAPPLSGIVTVLNTPFTADDQLDLRSLDANVERAVQAGVSGFLVPAMASEVGKLTRKERTAMVECVLSRTAGRAAVIAGCSAPTQHERLELARLHIDQGARSILVSMPFHEPDEYFRWAAELAELDIDLLVLQDWDFAGYGLPVELVARLSEEIPQFRMLKVEVAPAGVKYSAVKHATGGRLAVAGGWAVSQMIEALDRGVDAFMPTGLHEIYCKIYREYAAGRRGNAQSLFYRLLPALSFANQHLDISIHFFKRLLHAEGSFATARVRDPILPFDDVHESVCEELIRLCIALREELAAHRQ